MKMTYSRKAWLFSLVVILLFSGSLYTLWMGIFQNYAEQALLKLIEKELPTNYSIAYDELTVNWSEKELTVENLNLGIDSSVLINPNRRYYELMIPSFQLKLESVVSIIRDKELIIGGITIIDPRINIKDFPSADKFSVTSESVNILEFIGQYLELLEVEALQIQNADVEYSKTPSEELENFLLEDLDFHLKDFIVDSTGSRHHFLNAKSIELIVNEQYFLLKDGVHQCSFDRFRLSTQDSVLSLENFVLEPVEKHSDPKKSRYTIRVPNLLFDGLDYSSTYLESAFNIDQLILQHPSIYIEEPESPPSPKDTIQNAFQVILDRVAPKLNLHHLRLENAQVELLLRTWGHRKLQFDLEHLNVFECRFDADNFQFTRENIPIESFDLTINNFKKTLLDQLHQIAFEKITLNSKQRDVKINNFSFSPKNKDPHRSRTKMDHRIKQIKGTGINYFDLAFGAPIQLTELEISEPVTVLFPPQDTSNHQLPRLADIRHFLEAPYLNTGGVQHCRIVNGYLSVGDHLIMESYNFQLSDLSLNPDFSSWENFFNQLELHTGTVTYKNRKQNLQLKQLQTDGYNHNIRNLQAQLEIDHHRLTTSAGRLQLRTQSIDSLLKLRFDLDSLYLKDVNLDIVSGEPLKKEMAERKDSADLKYSIRHAQLENAQLNWRFPDSSKLKIERLNAAGEMNKSWELQELEGDRITFSSPKLSHHIDLEQLHKVGEDYSFDLVNLRLTPKRDALPLQHAAKVPLMKIRGWEKDKWKRDSIIKIHRLDLEKSKMALKLLLPEKKNTLKTADKTKAPQIIIDTVSMSEGSINGFIAKHTDTLTFDLPSLNLEMIQLINQPPEVKSFRDYFAALRLYLSSGLTLTHPDFDFQAGKITHQSRAEKLLLEQITFNSKDGKLAMQLDRLATKGFELEALLNDRILSAEQLKLGALEMDWKMPHDSVKDERSKLENKLEIALPFKKVNIHQFDLDTSDITFFDKENIYLQGIRLSLRGVNSDSLLSLDSLSKYYTRASLSIDDIRTRLGKRKIYELQQQVEYQSTNELLTLHQVKLKPLVSKAAYTQLLEYQEDFFDVKVDRMSVEHWKWEDAFKRPLKIQTLSMDGLKTDIFRDQNLPHPEQPEPLIQKQLEAIALPFLVDTLNLSGAIHFSILPAGEKEPGLLHFNQLNGQLTHITNIPEEQSSPMLMEAGCRLFNEVLVEAKARFDLQSPKQAFKLSGRVGAMDLTLMNKILEPTTQLWIKSGKNREITFEISANDEIAIGEMFFKYNRLKFRIVDKDEDHMSFGNSILSFWANRLVKSNNPSFLWKRRGIIYYERNPNRAIFNYWSRAFLSGIISSVGVKNNKKKLHKLGIEELEAVNYQEIFEKGFKIREHNKEEKR